MIRDYAQLLSTAHRVLDGDMVIGVGKTGRKQTRYVLPDSRESLLYTASHVNYPSAIWVRKSHHNYYNYDKSQFAKWANRNPPDWYESKVA